MEIRQMIKVVPTIAVLIIKDRKVLLVKHTEKAGHLTGTYGLPAGRINPGESEKGTAVRELLEETGLKSSEKDLAEFEGNYYIAELERKGSIKLKFGWRVFLCKNCSGEIKESEESIPEWVDIDELDSCNLLPNIKNATLAGLKFLQNEAEN